MNAAQTNLYLYEWGRARKWFREHGIDPKQADAKRHALHAKALGRDKSSKDFTNADLDKVIAAFRAISDGGNLDAQLAQIDQPEERRKWIIGRCWRAMGTFITGENENKRQFACEAYINGTAQRMFSRRYDALSDTQLAQVMGALERTARVRKAKREHAADPNPF